MVDSGGRGIKGRTVVEVELWIWNCLMDLDFGLEYSGVFWSILDCLGLGFLIDGNRIDFWNWVSLLLTSLHGFICISTSSTWPRLEHAQISRTPKSSTDLHSPQTRILTYRHITNPHHPEPHPPHATHTRIP
jgi:hypothetical protein